MQINNIRPMSWNPLGMYLELIFLKRTIKKLLATLVSKYGLGSEPFTFVGTKTSC
jgi:hypothetical protein